LDSVAQVNKLREAFAVLRHDPISLPMIAVVGSQSAGKSSGQCTSPRSQSAGAVALFFTAAAAAA
jgi:hypothetical protein